MTLPKLEAPRYKLVVPSTGKTIEYRPYLVKEEKILMLALESDETDAIFMALRDIITSCTFGKVDVDKLAIFDMEYIFLKLRAKSVGEVVELSLPCEKCEKKHKVSVNLDDITLGFKKIDNKIMLTDTVGVTLRYPTLGDLGSEALTASSPDKFLIMCIDSIFDQSSVWKREDSSDEELMEFVDSLSQKQLENIKDWFEKMPRLSHTIKFTCGNKDCGHQNEIQITGLQSFFT